MIINGKTFTRTYDSVANTVTVQSPSGRQSVATLDAKGRIRQKASPAISSTIVDYDARGRISRVAQGPREAVASYNTSGGLESLTDGLGHTSLYERDPMGQISRQQSPDSHSVNFEYNKKGDVVGVTPSNLREHRLDRDILGLLLSYAPPTTPQPTAETEYEYNADRQLTKYTSAAGNVLAISYEPSTGRASQVVSPAGTTVIGYDSSGRLATIAAPDNVGLGFSYDGSLLTRMIWSGPVSGSLALRYDNDFRVVGERVNGAAEVTSTYDIDGLLTSVGALTITRNPSTGRVQHTTLGQVFEAYTFNEFGELSNSASSCGSTPLHSIGLSRNTGGWITGRNETVLGLATSSVLQLDANGRLLQVTEGARTATYTYDGQGNRLTAARPATESYQYDSQDRLTQRGNVLYTYSPEGWLQTKAEGSATSSYVYDLLGNLRSATLPGGKVLSYLVDGANHRIRKLENGVPVQGFLYDEAGRVVAELDGQGALVSRFVYGMHSHVPDYILRDGATYRVIADTVGSPRLVVNVQSCVVAQQLNYDEFGRVLHDNNPGFQPFGFAGGLYDRDTALTRLGARDYDPEVGRWIAKDPTGFEGGDSNLYAYAGNNPIQFIDPSGLSFWDSLTDFSAGFGDTITFGATRWVRRKLGVDDVVNPCSGWYTAGGIAADVVVAVATSGAGTELKAAARAFCFAAGTEVQTPSGLTAIEDIEVGDAVWSYDESSKQVSQQKVVRVFETPDKPLLKIGLIDGEGEREQLHVTGEHPFWIEEQGWREAQKLRSGDRLFQLSGDWLRVESVKWTQRRETVYNFEVADTHSYFVGKLGAWVHNSCFDEIAKHAAKRFPGKSHDKIVRYLERLASEAVEVEVATGATIWWKGKEILIRRGASGTYWRNDTAKEAYNYFRRFIDLEGGPRL